ncbi:VOC family protein [Phycicoccus sp. Root563]|uniref:VOC family protein n=1 Tax=Phycicoccus sp. Root563 TaxID=1736562 RepID=UPI00351645BA
MLRPREGRSGPNLSLDGVGADPPQFPEIHLDLYARDQGAEVERLVALGARRVEDWPYPDEPHDFVVLQDPDGNRFCVVDASED